MTCFFHFRGCARIPVLQCLMVCSGCCDDGAEGLLCLCVCVFLPASWEHSLRATKGFGNECHRCEEMQSLQQSYYQSQEGQEEFCCSLHVCREGQALEYLWIVPCSLCTAFGEKEDGKEERGGGFGKGAVSSQEQGVPAIPGTLIDMLKSSPVVHPSFSHCSRETWSKSGIPAVTPEL